MSEELKKLPEMGDAVRKNEIYKTAEKKAGEYFDSKKVKPIYEKELKSRNPNPKRPKLKTSEKKTKQQIFKEKFGEPNDMPYAKLSKGGLKGNQKKLDKNNNNRIDAQDFKILKAEKGKVKKANLGILAMKKAKDKGAKGADFLSPVMLAKKMFNKKMGGVMKAKEGKLGEAKDYRKYLQGLKEATKSKSAQRAGRAALKAAKSTTIGKVALGVAGAGMAAKKFIESDKFKNILKKKMNKKMGGGMMKYTKGGGADTGKMGELRSKLGVAGDEFRRFKRSRPKLKAPDRKPMKPLKAMGGGMMMNKPMGYKSGKSIKVKCKLGRNKPTKMY